MPSRVEHEVLTVAGREVPISNPRKVLFPQAGYTKLDLARYYVAVAEGAFRAAGNRPNVLVRYPNGIDGEFFYQKRAPESRPDWIEVVALKFPSGRTAEEVVPRDAAALVWMANLACLELHPHPVRADDLDHPDELRIDLDPVPGVEWPQIRAVAGVVRATLADLGLVGWPKTSGSRGIHINVRIERRWTFSEVRRAALAFAREVEQRAPCSGDEQVVEGRAPRRVPRLQPERQGSDGGRRVLGAAEAGCARLGAADVGRDRRVRARRLHARDDAGALCVGWRSSRRRSISTRPRCWRCSSSRPATRKRAWATRRGRRITTKQPDEPARVQPSRRRVSKHPLIEIGRAEKKDDALAGLERWRARHPEAAAHLQPADVLVDAMRGRFHTWTRIRVNLQHVPTELRPSQEALDPNEETGGWSAEEQAAWTTSPRRRPSRARKES